MKKISTFFLAAALACSAGTPNKKLSSDLTSIAQRGSVRVIVQWAANMSASTAQKITALGGAVVSEFPQIHSGLYSVPSTALNALSLDPDVKFVSPDRQVHKKAAAPPPPPPAPGTTSQPVPYAATINAPYSLNLGFSGKGIGVAVVDSGINQDNDLGFSTNLPVYSEDFTGLASQIPGKVATPPTGFGPDWYGHGQHISGIIASNGKSSTCASCTETFTGIAPAASLINLKVLDANGAGTDSAVMAAINRAIALKDAYKIRVMNLSLGRPVYESYTLDPLCQAVESAWQAGIVVVVSAGNDGRDNSFGNDGYGTINAPGNDPYVITVGAMKDKRTADRSDDTIASYSSKGPTAVDHVVKPDLVAPGNLIVSLLAQNGTLALNNPANMVAMNTYQSNAPVPGVIPVQSTYDPTSNAQPPAVKVGPGYSKDYYTLSGTSMATAVVSGAVADLLQATPGLTPDQVKMLLMQTSSKTFPIESDVTDSVTGLTYTSYYDIFTIGAGYLDLKAALAAASQVPTGLTAISPIATYDSTTGDVELVFDPTSVFSDKAMWGASSITTNKAMWGASAIWSSSILVANKAMWGASAVLSSSSDTTANKAMWGASAIWSDKAMWGASSTTSPESVAVNGEQ